MKLVGERRAIAAIVFAFYFLMYFLMGVSGMVPPELVKAFMAIAGVYGLAFFALVAGYFWARWFAVGVGLYGVITAAVGMWQLGAEPILVFIGVTHAIAAGALWGNVMSVGYDGQTAWRERYHMDDNAVQRLGRSVIRAGVSLPFVLLYALAPKPDAAMLGGLAVLLLAGLGFRALVQLKTWGVFALGAAGSLMVVHAAASVPMALPTVGPSLASATALCFPVAFVGGALLLSAVAPFAAPIARRLFAR